MTRDIADEDISMYLNQSGAHRDAFFCHLCAQGCPDYVETDAGRLQFEQDWQAARAGHAGHAQRMQIYVGVYGQQFAQQTRGFTRTKESEFATKLWNVARLGAFASLALAFYDCGGCEYDAAKDNALVHFGPWIGGAALTAAFIGYARRRL